MILINYIFKQILNIIDHLEHEYEMSKAKHLKDFIIEFNNIKLNYDINFFSNLIENDFINNFTITMEYILISN